MATPIDQPSARGTFPLPWRAVVDLTTPQQECLVQKSFAAIARTCGRKLISWWWVFAGIVMRLYSATREGSDFWRFPDANPLLYTETMFERKMNARNVEGYYRCHRWEG
jgi:hypothetical protein